MCECELLNVQVDSIIRQYILKYGQTSYQVRKDGMETFFFGGYCSKNPSSVCTYVISVQNDKYISTIFLRYQYYQSYPIWLDNLNSCTSSSTDLRKCTTAVGVNDCSHSEDITLYCYGGETLYT